MTHADASGYLLYHSIGQYPGKAAALTDAMAGFAEVWASPDDGQWPAVLTRRAAFLNRWTRLIGAPDDSVTTAENVTSGLAALMLSLPRETLRGRRVLVAQDCFPSVHFLLTGLAPQLGFALDTVPLRQGASWVEDEDIAAAWTPEVGLALLTWVSSTSAHRSDVAALAAHGKAQGSLVGVDLTQGIGLLPFDVAHAGVDFTLASSLKWLCGTPGAGILHVDPALTERCAPALRGWFSQPDPFNWDLDRFAYASDVRRFDTGTPSVIAAVASLPALDWHASQDPSALIAHNRALTDRLIAGLDDLSLPLACPRDPNARGGSVMARLPDALSPTTVIAALRRAGCFADARGAVLRLSPGVMTTPDGVERTLAVLGGCVRGEASTA